MSDRVILRRPQTIEELKRICAYNNMPLERMRFFIGIDYKEPRAFGIFREGKDFIVYKNKDDGSRAVRYQGPSEKNAVNELFEKLLSECRARRIYPDDRLYFPAVPDPDRESDGHQPGNGKEARHEKAVSGSIALKTQDPLDKVSDQAPKDFFPLCTNIGELNKLIDLNRLQNAGMTIEIAEHWVGEFYNPTQTDLALLKRGRDGVFCVFDGSNAVYLGTNEADAAAWLEMLYKEKMPAQAEDDEEEIFELEEDEDNDGPIDLKLHCTDAEELEKYLKNNKARFSFIWKKININLKCSDREFDKPPEGKIALLKKRGGDRYHVHYNGRCIYNGDDEAAAVMEFERRIEVFNRSYRKIAVNSMVKKVLKGILGAVIILILLAMLSRRGGGCAGFGGDYGSRSHDSGSYDSWGSSGSYDSWDSSDTDWGSDW